MDDSNPGLPLQERMLKGPSAISHCPQAIRRGHKRAIIALAHKLLRTYYFMISRSEYYRDTAIDYEEMAVKRNGHAESKF